MLLQAGYSQDTIFRITPRSGKVSEERDSERLFMDRHQLGSGTPAGIADQFEYVNKMTSTHEQDELWNIQVSIAKSIANLKAPSLAQLHHDILEEIGQGPGLDIVDYFVSIADIHEDEIMQYFQCIGASTKGKINKDPRMQLAEGIAHGHAPTVLKLRQAFIKEFNEVPSEKVTEYFLKQIQKGPRDGSVQVDMQSMLNFAAGAASEPNPTVLKFRHEFTKHYGFTPSCEVTQLFLKKIQEKNSLKVREEDFESKANFAETVATGLNLTIFQFRQAYEKVYNEAPSVDIIDVFLKNLPRTGDTPRAI